MSKNSQERPVRVGLISLGCAKNLVDAEIMLGALLKDGAEITNDARDADVVIVNTCSFIDAAQEESVDTILESAEVRDAQKRGQGLVVSGCLPQRFREELPRLLPEVDVFMGIDQVTQVGEIVREARLRGLNRAKRPARERRAGPGRTGVLGKLAESKAGHSGEPEENLRATEKFGKTRTTVLARAGKSAAATPLVEVTQRPHFIPDYATPRFRLTPRHFAYLKIAEGCNHPCSFCIIPRMRGSHRSRQPNDVLAEARALLADGVKEINLISQDSTYYGLDLRPDHSRAIASPARFNEAVKAMPASAATISSLLRELNSLPGDFWIRLLYTHPAHWTEELIETIAECPKVARYVDMPLQHIHESMLERMRRETSRDYIEKLIQRIRRGIPGIALRTTFIVGFPGETDEYFESLLGFIRVARFERLGVFMYSREEGTRAGSMAGQVAEDVKQRRRELAMAAQREVASEIAAGFMGRELKVLTEGEASARDLDSASVSSWEHGLIRNGEAAPELRGRYTVARGESDAPDIDGRIYIRGRVPAGQFETVKIIGHTAYDLIAETA
ncbi:MAG TPA: 30S ribosomal protein S12 methylthiotransferase RimO [Verrucomicrobiae bacterium]|nr:30S ribosomal protein S12 methylthiotransferase RimO [Verrucomicrobiae bacterium]